MKNKIDGNIKVVDTNSKHPATFYGATKAATENFLMAQSYLSDMRINIVRPGYVFGNPAISGGNTQEDSTFSDIVKSALNNESIHVVKTDGTQFIWAGDLTLLYKYILNSDVNRKTYLGLSSIFVSWEEIAKEIIKRCNSTSEIIVEDRGWCEDGTFFDVADMKKDFGLEFNPWSKIIDHIEYYETLYKNKW